jgi:hypothetical protein
MDFVSKITQSREVSKGAKRGFDSLYPLQITFRFGMRDEHLV